MLGSTVYPPTEATLITLPPVSRMPQRQAHWVQISGATVLTPTVFIARGTSMSIMGPKYGFVAALLTRMSTAPKRSTVASTHARAASASPAFASNHATPSPPISSATLASDAPRREEIMTRAPCATNASAIARPMPRDAPVTTATLPASCGCPVLIGASPARHSSDHASDRDACRSGGAARDPRDPAVVEGLVPDVVIVAQQNSLRPLGRLDQRLRLACSGRPANLGPVPGGAPPPPREAGQRQDE